MNATPQVDIELVYRRHWSSTLASLIRILGDFDLAEESLQEAFASAVERWPGEGLPTQPRSWLISVARRKAIDRIRSQGRLGNHLRDIHQHQETLHQLAQSLPADESSIRDDQLRLIFTCCHPALSREAQLALTLRTLGGLETSEIARAFLVSTPTLAQRLVRAKHKIRTAGIPYQVPQEHLLEERFPNVLLVVYLIFNEGYAATAGDALVRRDLCEEAIRLGRLLVSLLPTEAEGLGLLALMLLQHSRRDSRCHADGFPILLEEQDRSLWHRHEIREGQNWLQRALRLGKPGPYQLQATIAAIHSDAACPEQTDWEQILEVYDLLYQMMPTSIVALNRVVAVAMHLGPEHALAALRQLDAQALRDYPYYHSVEGELFKRLNRDSEAIASYQRALASTENAMDRRFLTRQLAQLEGRRSRPS